MCNAMNMVKYNEIYSLVKINWGDGKAMDHQMPVRYLGRIRRPPSTIVLLICILVAKSSH